MRAATGCLLPAWLVLLLAACGNGAGLPGAPSVVAATPGNASASISFAPPMSAGQSAIAAYVASCSAAGETRTASAAASPVQVLGLTNGLPYACVLRASNSAGTGAASSAVQVTPQPDASASLASGYRMARWAAGMSVTFASECSMTLWPQARPSHAVDDFYLTPQRANQSAGQVVASSAQSGMPLVLARYSGDGAQSPMHFNICPSKAPTTTATNAGAIGVLISGAVLFAAAEISGHRATTQGDNVAHVFTRRNGQRVRAHLIDRCNGHPTPANAGNSYHYHGLSPCVTALADQSGGPSHLIGVALDGFPIYGDRDLEGQAVPPERLDACNGITSPTPEFPQGVYHYVLPSGARYHNASLRCYSAAVSQRELAAAAAAGFCYAPLPANAAQTAPAAMKMN